MKELKILLIAFCISASWSVLAQNSPAEHSFSTTGKVTVQDTSRKAMPHETDIEVSRIDTIPAKQDSTLTAPEKTKHQQADITLVTDTIISDTLNKDYECFYKTCTSELIKQKNKNAELRKRIREFNQTLDSLQAELNTLTEADADSTYGININDIDNLPVNINFQNKSYSVYIVNPHKNEINLYNKKDGGGYYDFVSINKRLSREGKVLLFAMNAGMYLQNREPQGLFIKDGKVLKEIDLTREVPQPSNFHNLMPNGVFALDELNKPYIVVSEDFAELARRTRIDLATQSGPMLVINGKFNEHFTKGSHNLNVRNGVGVNKNGKVVFVISDQPVNFYEFAELFRDYLGCDNALYLDGVISRMYLPELNRKSLQNSNHLGPIITVEK
jgi:uncharacterized protein YigE (DUF2233 family)